MYMRFITVYYASVKRHNTLLTVLKRAYFMTVIDDVCVQRACDRQTRDTFQPSRLTGVRLWEVLTLQTLSCEIGRRSRLEKYYT